MMITGLLLAACLRSQSLEADDLSTFDVRFSEGQTSFGKADVRKAIDLAHRLFVIADVEEDKRPRYFENRITVESNMVALIYRDRIVVSLSPQSGHLFAFNVRTPDKAKAPNLSVEDCVSKAIGWYKAAGGTRELAFDRSEVQSDGQRVYLRLDYVAPGNPYRFDACVETYVDRTFGFPETMWIGEPPAYDPPARLADREAVVANAVAAAMALTGWREVEVGVQEPRYHVPAYAGLPNRMSARHRRRAESSRAMLVYEISVNDARVPWKEGQDRPFVQVYADAETGEPIGILPAFAMQGGPPPASRPFAWDGRWQLWAAEGGVEPTEAEPTRANLGRDVCLTQGIGESWPATMPKPGS